MPMTRLIDRLNAADAECAHGNIASTCPDCTTIEPSPVAHERRPARRRSEHDDSSNLERERGSLHVGTASERKMKSERNNKPNQDATISNPEQRMFGVLDGMGGHHAGEVASSVGAAKIQEYFTDAMSSADRQQLDDPDHVANLLRASVIAAHDAVAAVEPARRDHPSNESNEGRPGSTASVVHLFTAPGETAPSEAIIAHVGDGQVLRFRNGAVEQLSQDDSLIQAYIDGGILDPDIQHIGDPVADQQLREKIGDKKFEEQRTTFLRFRNLVSQHLGQIGEVPNVHVSRHTLEAKDTILVLSDGISDNLTPARIAKIAREYADRPQSLAGALSSAASEIIAEATARKQLGQERTGELVRAKDDDRTAVVVHIVHAAPSMEAVAVPGSHRPGQTRIEIPALTNADIAYARTLQVDRATGTAQEQDTSEIKNELDLLLLKELEIDAKEREGRAERRLRILPSSSLALARERAEYLNMAIVMQQGDEGGALTLPADALQEVQDLMKKLSLQQQKNDRSVTLDEIAQHANREVMIANSLLSERTASHPEQLAKWERASDRNASTLREYQRVLAKHIDGAFHATTDRTTIPRQLSRAGGIRDMYLRADETTDPDGARAEAIRLDRAFKEAAVKKIKTLSGPIEQRRTSRASESPLIPSDHSHAESSQDNAQEISPIDVSLIEKLAEWEGMPTSDLEQLEHAYDQAETDYERLFDESDGAHISKNERVLLDAALQKMIGEQPRASGAYARTLTRSADIRAQYLGATTPEDRRAAILRDREWKRKARTLLNTILDARE
jgi:serine/threonine protein phosphatase PrpC